MAETYIFIDKLTELTKLIETMTTELVSNQMDEFKDNIPKFTNLLEMCFPQIIISYSDPMLSEVASDAEYWSNQLGRIVEAMSLDDKFMRIDVLYQETHANLLAFIDMIKDTKLASAKISEPESLDFA